jgi:hypothetical protein
MALRAALTAPALLRARHPADGGIASPLSAPAKRGQQQIAAMIHEMGLRIKNAEGCLVARCELRAKSAGSQRPVDFE